MTLSAGRPAVITLTATDDVGIAAATFFLDINKDNEWTEGVDRHLGEVFGPDAGTSDRFTFTYVLDQDAVGVQEGGGTIALRFAATARDTEGQWPVNAFTRDVRVYERHMLSFLLAEPVSGTQTRLTASVAAPYGLETTGIEGVTFWYDANRNGAWDAGIDTDLGYVTIASGSLQREYVLLATVNPAWPTPRQFAAAARDVRPAFDRFGTPRATIERASMNPPPVIEFASVVGPARVPPLGPIVAGQSVRIEFRNIDAGVAVATVFRDVNNNGLWDFTIDEDVTMFFTGGGDLLTYTRDEPTSKAWGGGVIALAIALRSQTGTGDDAWTPAFSVMYSARFEAWVEPTAQSSYTVAAQNAFTVDVAARDDNAVRGLRAFLDLDGDERLGPGDVSIDAGNIGVRSAKAQPRVSFRVVIPGDLAVGAYRVGLFASDFTTPNGPVTFFTLNVV